MHSLREGQYVRTIKVRLRKDRQQLRKALRAHLPSAARTQGVLDWAMASGDQYYQHTRLLKLCATFKITPALRYPINNRDLANLYWYAYTAERRG